MNREWISVNDKLPSTDGKFEVTIRTCRNKRYVDMCTFNKDAPIYKWGDKWRTINVIAWRERDVPYMGGGAEHENT